MPNWMRPNPPVPASKKRWCAECMGRFYGEQFKCLGNAWLGSRRVRVYEHLSCKAWIVVLVEGD